MRRQIAGHVRFEHVSFAYDDGTRSCRTSASQARPGEMVALVGLTGAGKTTLASLIPRFFEPTQRPRARRRRRRLAATRCARCASGSRSCRRSRCSSAARSPTTSATGGSTPPTRRSRRRHAPRTSHDFVAAAAERLRHAGGRSRRHAVRRRAPAARHRPRAAQGRADPDPRRAHVVARRHLGGGGVRRAAPAARAAARRSSSRIGCRRSATPTRILVLHEGRSSRRARTTSCSQSNDLYRRMCARLSVGRSLDEPESVDELMQAPA